MVDFEEAFSDFLDRSEYDAAANALFTISRESFKAGWLAAGGSPLKPQPIFTLIRNENFEEPLRELK